jgi:thiosulfate reductase cytochrome b subunit
VSSAGDGPSATAVFPRLRIGRRWANLVWTIPLVAVLLAVVVGASILLRTLPAVQQFIAQYPGSVPNDAPEGFPVWLRWQHFLNAIFLVPIVRAGLQIWAGRPRLYWRKPTTPGHEWLRIQRAMPDEHHWPMREDAVALHPQVGLPGKRLTSGLARWWHLVVTFLWLANGILFYVLIFVTGQWMRIVPTTLDVFPHALSAAIQYGSLDFPTQDSWVAYNGLQLITYFLTVFVAAPLAVLTGILHAPSLARRFANSRFLNVEVVRSVHVLVLGYFIVFVIAHVSLVLITGATTNLNHITLGTQDSGWAGFTLFAIAVVVGGVVWALLSPLTLRYPNAVQKVGARVLGPIGRWF